MYEYKKTVQLLSYFANKHGGGISKLKALKLVYFADKYHLRKYARTITNDIYYAMNNGPVASNTLNIANIEDFLLLDQLQFTEEYLEICNGRKVIKALKETDLNYLSESDIEAADFAYNEFAKMNRFDLAKYTHQYKEWQNCLKNLKCNENPLGEKNRIKLDIKDFLEDAPAGVIACYDISSDEKDIALEQIELNSMLCDFFETR